MNQILLTENVLDKDKDKDNKRKSRDIVNAPSFATNTSKNSTPIDTKKIIIFFAIAIGVLGIAIVSIFAARAMKKRGSSSGGNASKPQVAITYDEDNADDFISVSLKSDVGIEKITYTWDNDVPVTENLGGRPSYDLKIDIPIGATSIQVEVTDVNGQTTSSTQSVVPSTSSEKPVIKPVVIEGEDGKQLKIVATSGVPIKYITYKWNDEEEVRIDAEEEDTTFETIIELRIGNNDIALTVVDNNNNKGTYKSPIVTKNDPIIDVTRNEDRLYLKVSHEKGLKKIEYDVNGETYVYDEKYSAYDPAQKEVEFSFAMEEGENTVVITAISNEETETVYRGRCDYTATAEEE